MSTDHYPNVARQVLDVVNEFGECRVRKVEHMAELRKAVRAEGRRRKLRGIRTHVIGDEWLFCYSEEPSIEAQAFQVVSSSLVADVMNRAFSGEQHEPVLDASVRMVDASEPLVW